ncbi:uncharacterized protein LOC112555208 [Pomacea canaliculata]|uniref:uncharacterized protein LOC112555208 n=1 Tax=Pomacea canaliculata TaxID=400727 RepID=UPI000D732300|nr:uncharacterized protein LOC112555208 [Pomacea canaliculata]
MMRTRAGLGPPVATSTNNNSPTVTRGFDPAPPRARTSELRAQAEEGSRTSAERLLLPRVQSTARTQNAFTGLPGTRLTSDTGAFVGDRDRSSPLDSKRSQSFSDAALGLQLPASQRSAKGASELELRLLSREAQEELLRQQQLQLQHQHQLQSQRQQQEQLPRSDRTLQGATGAGQKRANSSKFPLKLKSDFPPRYVEVSLRVNLIKSREAKQADTVTNMVKSSSSSSDSPERIMTSNGPNTTSDLKGISSPNGGNSHMAGPLDVQQNGWKYTARLHTSDHRP